MWSAMLPMAGGGIWFLWHANVFMASWPSWLDQRLAKLGQALANPGQALAKLGQAWPSLANPGQAWPSSG